MLGGRRLGGKPRNKTIPRTEVYTEGHTPDFSLDAQGVKGFCPAGEVYANQQIEAERIPVLSCEGPCIRGEIARLAANLVAQEVPSLARACHAEAFFVPHSSMARWVRGSDKSIMIDGCFLEVPRARSEATGRGRESRSHRCAATVQEIHRHLLDR